MKDSNITDLLTEWSSLDKAIKRVQLSTPEQLTTAIRVLELARSEMHELVVNIAKEEMGNRLIDGGA